MVLRLDTGEQSVFKMSAYQVRTPDGEMFVIIMEDDNAKPCGIEVKIGKVGGPLGAWAHSFSRIITLAIEHGVTINDLIEELSSQTSDSARTITHNNIPCRSGPEGVCIALMHYRSDKFAETAKQLGIDPDDQNGNGKGARLAGRNNSSIR